MSSYKQTDTQVGWQLDFTARAHNPRNTGQVRPCSAVVASATANSGVASLILARSHTFVVTSENMFTKYWLTT